MLKIEERIIHSFRHAKNDIMKLQNDFILLSQTQERIMEMIDQLRANDAKILEKLEKSAKNKVKVAKSKPKAKKTSSKAKTKVVRVVSKRAKKTFVATKGGKKFHVEKCPYALNIKPKHKVRFNSKVKALNEGYKPCKCV